MKEHTAFLGWILSCWHFWGLLIAWIVLDVALGALTVGELIVRSIEKFLCLFLIYLIIYLFIKIRAKPKKL